MKRPEILAPAGTMDALKAAVNCGADAVYIGASRFSARAYAQNFDEDSLAQAVAYCHERGVDVHLALNTLLLHTQERVAAGAVAMKAARAGVDAIIVQDLTLADILQRAVPEMPLHASTQLSVTDRWGAEQMDAFGFDRVVVGREVSREELRSIIDTEIPVEVFVHGALCMSVSGQCYMSAALGGRSGNRGRCAGACRLPFENHCLSLKDMSLISHVREMAEMGVASFKIEGRMRRPEYVAAAVTAVRQALEGDTFDEKLLAAAFSRSGLTDGYYTGRRGSPMFGWRVKEDVTAMAQALPALQKLAREPVRRIPVDAALVARPGMAARLILHDGVFSGTAVGDIPQPAKKVSLTDESIRESLAKMGDTPYVLRDLNTRWVHPDLFLSKASLNALRRDAAADLARQRSARPAKKQLPYIIENGRPLRASGKGETALTVSHVNQLEGVDRRDFVRIAVPLSQWDQAPVDFRSAVALPRAQFGDAEEVRRKLQEAYDGGVRLALCSNLGAVALAKEMGFTVWGDFSLCCTGASMMDAHAPLGVTYHTLTPEADAPSLLPFVPPGREAGVILYGKLPLMVMRNCPVKQTDHYKGCTHRGCHIVDRKGISMPVLCDGQVSYVCNPRPIWLADRKEELPADFFTVSFTDETPGEIPYLLECIKEGRPSPVPFTRGLSSAITSWEQSEDISRDL